MLEICNILPNIFPNIFQMENVKLFVVSRSCADDHSAPDGEDLLASSSISSFMGTVVGAVVAVWG